MSEQHTAVEQAKRKGPEPAPLLGENIKRISAEWAAKMKAVPKQTRQAFDKALQDLVDIVRKGLEAAGDELAARHFDRPRSIEDWKHLALIVEIPPEKIGDLTLGEIYDCARAWADRQIIKAKLLASAPTSTKPGAAPSATVNKAGNRMEWLTRAILSVNKHPDWSDAEIARHVGVHRGTLTRNTTYRRAAALARGSKTDLPRGYVKTESHDVEAVAPPSDCSDRGTRIPGSKYYREYCAQCGEPMRVTEDKVGTKPRCDRCAQ